MRTRERLMGKGESSTFHAALKVLEKGGCGS